jgi:hypothetical protein
MGRALQVINGQVTNPGATVSALTPNAGDSYTVQNAPLGSKIKLLDAWAFTTTNLLMRVHSPKMHDNVQNNRMQPVASKAYPLMDEYGIEDLFPQDPLVVEVTGGAAEVDGGALLIYYDNLPGINARLFHREEILPHVAHRFGVEVDLTSSATSMNYSATVAINASFDTFERGYDYAILGYTCATDGLSVGLKGADTGNLRLGGPLVALPFLTSSWFVELSRKTGLPTIPVFNSGNVASLVADVVAQATSTAYKVTFNCALLDQTLAGHAA